MAERFNITEVRNGAYIDADGSIDCEINHPKHGWIPYTIKDDDTDETINNSELKALLGSNIVAYTPPTQAELDEAAAGKARGRRNHILSTIVDPMVSNPLRWSELSSSQQTSWTQFRTDLLNIPQQSNFPHNISWPTSPDGYDTTPSTD